jgi:hypothetical protein
LYVQNIDELLANSQWLITIPQYKCATQQVMPFVK